MACRHSSSSARDRLDAEEGLSVIVSLPVVELALVLQKRRRLHEKDVKGSSGSVLYRVMGIGAGFAHVGEASGVLTYNHLEMIEAYGPGHRSLWGLKGAHLQRSQPP